MEDLLSGSSSLDWKDGILPSQLHVPQLCAEEVLRFLKEEKEILIVSTLLSPFSDTAA